MEKEKVILDYLEEDKVAVYSYDDMNGGILEEPIEVCPRVTAEEIYKVVGEIVFGNIELYKNGDDEKEEDYSEFSDIDEEAP